MNNSDELIIDCMCVKPCEHCKPDQLIKEHDDFCSCKCHFLPYLGGEIPCKKCVSPVSENHTVDARTKVESEDWEKEILSIYSPKLGVMQTGSLIEFILKTISQEKQKAHAEGVEEGRKYQLEQNMKLQRDRIAEGNCRACGEKRGKSTVFCDYHLKLDNDRHQLNRKGIYLSDLKSTTGGKV